MSCFFHGNEIFRQFIYTVTDLRCTYFHKSNAGSHKVLRDNLLGKLILNDSGNRVLSAVVLIKVILRIFVYTHCVLYSQS